MNKTSLRFVIQTFGLLNFLIGIFLLASMLSLSIIWKVEFIFIFFYALGVGSLYCYFLIVFSETIAKEVLGDEQKD